MTNTDTHYVKSADGKVYSLSSGGIKATEKMPTINNQKDPTECVMGKFDNDSANHFSFVNVSKLNDASANHFEFSPVEVEASANHFALPRMNQLEEASANHFSFSPVDADASANHFSFIPAKAVSLDSREIAS